MRELKFRVWDIESKSFCLNEDIGNCFFTSEGFRYGAISVLKGKFKNLIIQQFTGLIDKNGKEIYEGDICNIKRFGEKTWILGKVIWGCEHGWSFRSFYTNHPKSDYFGTRFVEADEIEVIGNIFEDVNLIQ